MRGRRDLRLLVAAAIGCAVVALLLPWGAVSLLFAAPLALLMPGYAITAAAFAGRELEWPRVVLLSIALSLAVLALGALPLNYLPGGINGLSWALLLVLVVAGAARVAAVRDRRDDGPAWSLPQPRLRGARLAIFAAALAAFAGALALASTTQPADEALGFTELWIVPAPGTERSRAQIGVESQEQETVEFDLRIVIGERKVVRRSFTLRPGEGRVVGVGTGPAPAGARVPVVATLLRHAEPFAVYRRVKGFLIAQPETAR